MFYALKLAYCFVLTVIKFLISLNHALLLQIPFELNERLRQFNTFLKSEYMYMYKFIFKNKPFFFKVCQIIYFIVFVSCVSHKHDRIISCKCLHLTVICMLHSIFRKVAMTYMYLRLCSTVYDSLRI